MASRQLTANEIKLCQSVFGNAIDYTRVRIHDHKMNPWQPKGTSISLHGRMFMYGNYMEDYSKGPAHMQKHFIHEMAHVWQYQNKVLNQLTAATQIALSHNFNYNAGYAYTLTKDKDLIAYNMEQQASIIEDYFMIQHKGAKHYTGVCQNKCTFDEKMKLYENVLKNFLKNPHYANKKNNTPKPPSV